jgi:hypothetical protein
MGHQGAGDPLAFGLFHDDEGLDVGARGAGEVFGRRLDHQQAERMIQLIDRDERFGPCWMAKLARRGRRNQAMNASGSR